MVRKNLLKALYERPLDRTWTDYWGRVDPAFKRAFFVIVGINLLAFGFEMTNLTMHHDDVAYIFIQDTILGHYLGRFGLGWLYYHTQNAYYMPFLQMLQGIVIMTFYGMLISRFWGLRKTLDIVLVSSILSVFPYMAQIYSYNIIMAALPAAHFLSAAAVVLAARATLINVVLASFLYVAAFSIYQSIVANAATVFMVWILANLLFNDDSLTRFLKRMIRPAAAVLVSVMVGGIVYVAIVSSMNIDFDSYQHAGDAFSVSDGIDLPLAVAQIINGTRAFFLWPENYFPHYLKLLQLVFIFGAGTICLWVPEGIGKKLTAGVIFLLVLVAPRVLQIAHPQGNFHALTLTAYAVVVAGCVMIINNLQQTFLRNASTIVATVLLAGYLLQCNWISTVNYLNTLAHFTAYTQISTRIKSLADAQWDGKSVAVFGRYDMYSGYPYRGATGVATQFMDAGHAQSLAHLMRENYTILKQDQITPRIHEYAETRPPWPHPDSVSVMDGVAVVVLSNDSKGEKPAVADENLNGKEPGSSL